MACRLWWCILLAGAAAAQPVKVYSEFQRVDPFGEILALDRAESPREILSPALVRGAWSSFMLAVIPDAGRPFHVYFGQNPEGAATVNVYKVLFTRQSDRWIPNLLEPLKLSGDGRLPEIAMQVPGQKVVALWMEIRFRPDAPVDRTRLEIQYNSGDDWFIYPLELRPQSQVAPESSGALERLAGIEAPASESAAAVLRAYACGEAAAGGNEPLSVRSMIRRDARQDIALARSLEKKSGSRTALLVDLFEELSLGNVSEFCRGAATGAKAEGAEWYLRVRDYVNRLALGPQPKSLPKPTITVRPAP